MSQCTTDTLILTTGLHTYVNYGQMPRIESQKTVLPILLLCQGQRKVAKSRLLTQTWVIMQQWLCSMRSLSASSIYDTVEEAGVLLIAIYYAFNFSKSFTSN